MGKELQELAQGNAGTDKEYTAKQVLAGIDPANKRQVNPKAIT